MMDIIMSENFNAMWDAISSIMAVIATLMAVFALIYSVRTYKQTMQIVHYGEIDRMYFEILKEALAKPYLANSERIRDETQSQEYEIYAFIVWNFLEAIYDRCMRDPELQKTWYPILETESDSHKEWLFSGDNQRKFKSEFLHFIENEHYRIL